MRRHASPPGKAFSLLELIIVMAVIVVLMSLIVPAVGNFGRATALTTGGNLIANLATFARQNAMSKSTLTALVVLGDAGTPADYRAVTLLEYNNTYGDWAPIAPWKELPPGVITTPTLGGGEGALESSFFKYSPAKLPVVTAPGAAGARLAQVRYDGKEITRYAARIFLPSGSLQNPEDPALLRLVEGFWQDGQVTYTRPGADGTPANYYDVAIVGTTGIAKVDRP